MVQNLIAEHPAGLALLRKLHAKANELFRLTKDNPALYCVRTHPDEPSAVFFFDIETTPMAIERWGMAPAEVVDELRRIEAEVFSKEAEEARWLKRADDLSWSLDPKRPGGMLVHDAKTGDIREVTFDDEFRKRYPRLAEEMHTTLADHHADRSFDTAVIRLKKARMKPWRLREIVDQIAGQDKWKAILADMVQHGRSLRGEALRTYLKSQDPNAGMLFLLYYDPPGQLHHLAERMFNQKTADVNRYTWVYDEEKIIVIDTVTHMERMMLKPLDILVEIIRRSSQPI